MSTGVPGKGTLLQNGEKHGALRGQKAYIQWGAALFPKGTVNDAAVTTQVPCSVRYVTFHLGLGGPEPC
jgi:hypothetical protein